jgi:hypothetical protein
MQANRRILIIEEFFSFRRAEGTPGIGFLNSKVY